MVKRAMILAAGLGQRMRPLTDTLPKPLISIAGKSMLDRAFDHLQRNNISSIVVNTHYLAPLIEKHIKSFYPQTLISHEEILLETGGGIKKALPLLVPPSLRTLEEGEAIQRTEKELDCFAALAMTKEEELSHSPFFVLNGDSIWSNTNSLNEMRLKWDEKLMEALLLLIPRERAHGYEGPGDFHMDSQGRLTRPKEGEEAAYVYIGVQILTPRLFRDAPLGPFSMNFLWDQALDKGHLYGHCHKGEWFHMSTPLDIKRYSPMIAELES